MHQPALTSPPEPPAHGEPAMRPKVLRRPAQWGKAASSAEILPMHEDVRVDFIPAAPAPAPTALPGWQEDSRFGVALLAIILLLNLLVVGLLARDEPPASEVNILAAPATPVGE